MLAIAPHFLPKKQITPYKVVSVFLYLIFILIIFIGALSLLFPYTKYQFDFNNPEATKNTLFSPHLNNFNPIEKGKVPNDNSLFLYANNWHNLESADISVTLSESSQDNDLHYHWVVVKHGWSALFLPRSENMLLQSPVTVREYQGNYYEVRDGTLYPFVSEQAALSHTPRESMSTLSRQEFENYKKGEEFSGFRPGTLLAYADGVFLVTENRTLRPFGSADILTRLGYSFDHIIKANAEEAGIYTRDKIILTGQMHPSGTLFQNNEGMLYILENFTLRPVAKSYADYLSSKNDVISFSEDALKEMSYCVLEKDFLQKSYSCRIPFPDSFQHDDDYQFSFISEDQELDISLIKVGLQASRKEDNARFVGRMLTTRILERFGF